MSDSTTTAGPLSGTLALIEAMKAQLGPAEGEERA